MKILVVHTWLKGNLGDVLQASVLMRALRELDPTTLDLAGFPAQPGPGTDELLALADRHVPEPFVWYWRYAPSVARRLALEPGWRRWRRALFSKYDVIVSAPGPFLAAYDLRLPSALCDIGVAADLGMPFVLSSHSIGPVPPEALDVIRGATLCVARESRTHDYLARHGVDSVLSADLAFLYPYRDRLDAGRASPFSGQYRLLFLRSNNLRPRDISFERGELRCGSLRATLAPGERLVLATSDARRDERFLRELGRRLGVPDVACRSVAELVALVAGSTGVISDRYHPAICAAALEKPAEVLINHEPHKMHGLQDLLRRHELENLRSLARAGLESVRATLQRTPDLLKTAEQA